MLLKVLFLIIIAAISTTKHEVAIAHGAGTGANQARWATVKAQADGIKVEFVNGVPGPIASSVEHADACIIMTNTTKKDLHIAYQYYDSLNFAATDSSGATIALRSGVHPAEVRTRTYIAPGEVEYIPIRLRDWLDVSAGAYYVKAFVRATIYDSPLTFTHRYVFATDPVRVDVH